MRCLATVASATKSRKVREPARDRQEVAFDALDARMTSLVIAACPTAHGDLASVEHDEFVGDAEGRSGDHGW